MDYDFINQGEKLFSKKNIITYLLLGILILAIPLGVRLVQQQQILKSKAATGDEITFPDLTKKDSNGVPISQSTEIKIRLNSPFGAQTPDTKTQ